MPVSKRRKTAAKRSTPKPVAPVLRKHWTLKLHSSELMHLRNNPDFQNLVKIGRMLNALTFGITIIEMTRGQKTFTDKRQFRRACYILGGYLHEAINLVDHLKGPYLGEEKFEPLRELVVEKKYFKFHKYARKVRNYLAFHLDELDAVTSDTIAMLKPSNYLMMCGDDQSYGAYYFEFADFIDTTYLTEDLTQGNRLQTTADEALADIMSYGCDFIEAAWKFQGLLWNKTVKAKVY